MTRSALCATRTAEPARYRHRSTPSRRPARGGTPCSEPGEPGASALSHIEEADRLTVTSLAGTSSMALGRFRSRGVRRVLLPADPETERCGRRCGAAAATSASSPRSGSRCPRQPDRDGRTHLPGGRRHHRRAALLPGFRRRSARRTRHRRQARHRPAAAGHSERACTGGRPSSSPAATPARSTAASGRWGPSGSSGRRLVDLLAPCRYAAFQGGLDDTVLHGWHYYWKANDLSGLSDGAIDVIADHAYSARSPRSYSATSVAWSAGSPRRHRLRRPRRRPRHHRRRRVAPL